MKNYVLMRIVLVSFNVITECVFSELDLKTKSTLDINWNKPRFSTLKKHSTLALSINNYLLLPLFLSLFPLICL